MTTITITDIEEIELGTNVRRAMQRESSLALRPRARTQAVVRRALDALMAAVLGHDAPRATDAHNPRPIAPEATTRARLVQPAA